MQILLVALATYVRVHIILVKGMPSLNMKCSDEKFISNLIEANKRARVDPEIIDLIAAYARLCLKYGKDLKFYDESPTLETKKITVTES